MDWKRKLSSRKFWLSVANFIAMLVVVLGGNSEVATQVTGVIFAGGGVVAYILAEGYADATHGKYL